MPAAVPIAMGIGAAATAAGTAHSIYQSTQGGNAYGPAPTSMSMMTPEGRELLSTAQGQMQKRLGKPVIPNAQAAYANRIPAKDRLARLDQSMRGRMQADRDATGPRPPAGVVFANQPKG